MWVRTEEKKDSFSGYWINTKLLTEDLERAILKQRSTVLRLWIMLSLTSGLSSYKCKLNKLH